LDIVGINEVNEESYIVKFALKGGEKLWRKQLKI
jgi:hypothetical protein